MKKIFTRIIAGMLSLSLLPTINISAEEKVDKNLEKAILTAKERITIPPEFSKFNFEKTTSLGQSGYNLNWSKEDGKYGTIYVTVIDDIILGYRKYDDTQTYTDRRKFAKLSKDALYAKAEEQVQKLNPTIYSNIKIEKNKLNASVNSTIASFPLIRVSGGLEVYGDNGNIELNKDNGELYSFSISWLKDIAFLPKSNVISQANAKKAFTSEVGIEPIYVVKRDYTKKTQTATIIYQPKKDYVYLNANSGKIDDLNPNYYGWYGGYAGGGIAEEAYDMDDEYGVARNAFTKQELEKVETEKNLITAKEAMEKLLSEASVLAIGENPVLKSSNLSYDSFNDTKYSWNLSFEYATSDKKTQRAYAVLDAETGAVKSFNGLFALSTKNALNEKAADTLVNTALKKYLGDAKFSEYKLTSVTTNKEDGISPLRVERSVVASTFSSAEYTSRYYAYERYVNGIKVKDDIINVTLNSEGKISTFNYYYTDIKFPSSEKNLSEDKALAKLYSQRDMTLMHYINIDKNNKITTSILYQMPSFYLNALTGNLCDYYGDPISEVKHEFDDVKDKNLKAIAEKLSMNGVFLPSINGKLLADSKITKSDFAYLMSTAGIYINIQVKEETNNLLKKDAVKYFIDALGGKEFALLEGIYTAPFKDVSRNDKYVGYFTFAKAMKILKADQEGKISPNFQLTRGEALQMIYNYLNSAVA